MEDDRATSSELKQLIADAMEEELEKIVDQVSENVYQKVAEALFVRSDEEETSRALPYECIGSSFWCSTKKGYACVKVKHSCTGVFTCGGTSFTGVYGGIGTIKY